MSPDLQRSDGGSRAFAQQVYDEQFWYVWNTLRRLGIEAADLEDVTQEVFVGAVRALPTLDVDRPLRPWLFVLAFRAAKDWKGRAHHRYEDRDAVLEGIDEAANPEAAAVAAQARRSVHDALGALDLDQRAVFVAHELNGHSIPEIASALRIPLNTAYSRLRLARAGFAAALRQAQGASS